MIFDYLNLLETDFSKTQLVLFSGKSGSGKTTAIQFLLDHHPEFQSKAVYWIQPHLSQIRLPKNTFQTIVVDEIRHIPDLFLVWRLLTKGFQLLVASHIASALLLPVRMVFHTRAYSTDRNIEKLRFYLQEAKMPFQEEELRLYVRHFGAVFGELKVIVERGQGLTFGQALHRFWKLDHFGP